MKYLKKANTSAEEFSSGARKAVEEVLADIRANGEDAVRELAKKFDKWEQDFVLSPEKKPGSSQAFRKPSKKTFSSHTSKSPVLQRRSARALRILKS